MSTIHFPGRHHRACSRCASLPIFLVARPLCSSPPHCLSLQQQWQSKSTQLDGSEQKAQTSSRFDSLSEEDTADIFDDLVVESDAEDGSEAHSPSIAPATGRQRDRALRLWHHPKFWE